MTSHGLIFYRVAEVAVLRLPGLGWGWGRGGEQEWKKENRLRRDGKSPHLPLLIRHGIIQPTPQPCSLSQLYSWSKQPGSNACTKSLLQTQCACSTGNGRLPPKLWSHKLHPLSCHTRKSPDSGAVYVQQYNRQSKHTVPPVTHHTLRKSRVPFGMWAWVNSAIKSISGELCSPYQHPFSGYSALGIKKTRKTWSLP